MPSIFNSEYSNEWIVLGNHDVYGVSEVLGLDVLPAGLDGRRLLTLTLPSIALMADGLKVGEREFYLCYSPQHSFLFVVEIEVATRVESTYRAQYGANDNYDTYKVNKRVAWIYTADSPRAKDSVIAAHLKGYFG